MVQTLAELKKDADRRPKNGIAALGFLEIARLAFGDSTRDFVTVINVELGEDRDRKAPTRV